MNKGIVALGNLLHHYESSLFVWMTPFLVPILFPDQKESLDSLFCTLALIPLKYLGKPVGALFWGWLGDLLGRKPTLTASLIGMSLATCAMGFLPLTSHAWWFLTLCRFLQGFFSVGEEKGSALYLLEQTATKRRPWMSALYDASGIAGILLASLLASWFGGTHWRVLFWVGALGGAVGVILRYIGEESKEFVSTPFHWGTLYAHWKVLTKIAVVSGFSYGNYYLVTVFLNHYLPLVSFMTHADALILNTHLLWIDALFLLAVGALCSSIAKEKIMITAALLIAALAIPLFTLFDSPSPLSWWNIAIVRLTFTLLGVAFAAPYHAWQLEQLPPQHRFLLTSVGSTLGSSLVGAPLPMLATYLLSRTGHVWTAPIPLTLLGIAAAMILHPIRLSRKVVL